MRHRLNDRLDGLRRREMPSRLLTIGERYVAFYHVLCSFARAVCNFFHILERNLAYASLRDMAHALPYLSGLSSTLVAEYWHGT